MRQFFEAVANGRLFELGSTCKEEALCSLAQRLRDNLEVAHEADFVAEIRRREQEFNTGIGCGVAVPHLRALCEDGPVYCVLGWSGAGIDYGAPDGEPVHLIVMYYIPDAQRNAYLREIAALVKLLMKRDVAGCLVQVRDLGAMHAFLMGLGNGCH
ncbi:MAG: PTS sugar transporter subunit IIA [Puniceicoccales bacterium]|jgi:mannitol/fructose-specific phosphotransferase system IIA component (Ntr-type)|nr:PTS sugar transporter subunit IIA [Puniceicoccales bacterium]